MVVRPAMKTLQNKHVSITGGPSKQIPELQANGNEVTALLPNTSAGSTNHPNYVQQLAMAKELVAQDPRQVAKLVKNWVVPDGE